MDKVAVVILNYLNYKDTEECMESLLMMNYPQVVGCVIVDNNSNNEAYPYLKDKYKDNNKISVISTSKNFGFAKGNNIGISYARKKFKADFIMVINNDTVFIDDEYFDKMLSKFRDGVGVIGSSISLPGGNMQRDFKMYDTFPGILLDACLQTEYCAHRTLPSRMIYARLTKMPQRTILHGCALLFTPYFFRFYNGFFDKTFLYYEEMILSLMCEASGIIQIKQENAVLFHKEDMSSEMSFGNDSDIKRKYMRQSVKWVIFVKLITGLKKFGISLPI